MDDYVILDTNKERLKEIWKVIDKELTKLKLKINRKSNIYRLSIEINFLGYKYRYINNKLVLGYDKKTYGKINKKLNYLKDNDYIKYNRSKASYYGYFKKVIKGSKVSFKMKLEEVHDVYKKKYKMEYPVKTFGTTAKFPEGTYYLKVESKTKTSSGAYRIKWE